MDVSGQGAVLELLDVKNVFSDVLASILWYKSTGLIMDPTLSQIMHQHDNGYETLYDHLVHVGHPSLQAYPSLPAEPCQHTIDCKLADYCLAWNIFTPCIRLSMVKTCPISTYAAISVPHASIFSDLCPQVT